MKKVLYEELLPEEFVDGEDQAQNLKKYVGDSCLELGRKRKNGFARHWE